MTVRDWTEQLWFAVAIGGFLIFLEEAIIWMVEQVFHKKIPKEIPRMVAGLAIFGLALYKLATLPAT